MRVFLILAAVGVAALDLEEPIDPCWASIEFDGKIVTTEFPQDIDDAGLLRLTKGWIEQHDLTLRLVGGPCDESRDPACVPNMVYDYLREKRDACAAYSEPEREAREAALEASRDRCGNAGGYGTPRRRIALAFWGVNRSLKFTLASIRRRIFEPLERACVDYEVFLAAHDIDEVHNPRGGEYHLDVRGGWRDLLDELKPVGFTITPQRDFLRSIDPADWITEGAGDERAGLGNLTFMYHLCELDMLKSVTEHWKEKKSRYGAVVYLRHDVEFVDDLDVVDVLTSRDGELAVPFFQTSDGHPSDVFAYGTPSAAMVFGERLDSAREYARGRYLNSHRFLGWALDRAGVAVRLAGMRLRRVRATGHRAWLDSCVAAPYCVLANDGRDCFASSCVAGRRTYQAEDVTESDWVVIDAQLARGNAPPATEPFDPVAWPCCREPERRRSPSVVEIR